MTLHFLDMPNDAARLAVWLEDRLMSDSLGELVGELTAVHPSDASLVETVDQLIGARMADVLSSGLKALPEAQLRKFISEPWLLLDLQERILIDGGSHWSSRSLTSAETQVLARVKDKLSTNTVASSQATVTPAPGATGTAKSQRGSWIGSLALALGTFACGLLLRGQFPDFPSPSVIAKTSCRWARPNSMNQQLSGEAYLLSLADGAADWKLVENKSPSDLATHINQFRQGCSVLILAEHKPLSPDDKVWLKEKCQKWASKLDGHLVQLEAGGDFETVRNAADTTINDLIKALRGKAAVVAKAA